MWANHLQFPLSRAPYGSVIQYELTFDRFKDRSGCLLGPPQNAQGRRTWVTSPFPTSSTETVGGKVIIARFFHWSAEGGGMLKKAKFWWCSNVFLGHGFSSHHISCWTMVGNVPLWTAFFLNFGPPIPKSINVWNDDGLIFGHWETMML